MLSRAVISQHRPDTHAFIRLGPDAYKERVAERVMREVDALPPEWRALVNEFGFSKIKRMRGMSYAKARNLLLSTQIDLSDLGL